MMSDIIEVSSGIKTKEIELPSYKGSKIIVLEELSVDKQREINRKHKMDTAEDKLGYMVACYVAMIQQWNLGDKGEVLPINEETVSKYFYKHDMIAMNAVMAGITYEEAKDKTEEQIAQMAEDKKKENS